MPLAELSPCPAGATTLRSAKMKMPLSIAALVSVLVVRVVLADDVDFKREYSTFGEAPKASVRPLAEQMVKVSLKDFELEAENVEEAFHVIRNALKATDYPYGLSLIMMNPDEKNYRAHIKISKGTRTLGEAINLLCEQADLVWDFSSLKLTFKPKKAEPAGAGQPATRPVDKPEGGDKPQPEAEGRSR